MVEIGVRRIKNYEKTFKKYISDDNDINWV